MDTDLTVSQFLELLNVGIKQFNVTVAGEITGRVNRRGGVTYFTIHDQEDDAAMTCMGFNSIMDKLGIELEEGMAVRVSGYPEVWKRTGMFSFKAFQIMLSGEGTLKRQFEALKRKLEAEGLFSAEYKKPLPRFIRHIGLITAADREAHNDFIKHLPRHGLDIVLHDVRVEGAQAIQQVCEAIERFNRSMPEIEVLVVTRGGGSLESLAAFNSEDIARAIFASRIPVISAIGHERDVTVADFVADVRASTPTHAAKIISEDWERAALELDSFTESWRTELAHYLQNLAHTIAGFEQSLQLVNPELKLSQGYSIVRAKNGGIIKSAKKIKAGDKATIQFYDGKKDATF